eukprot:12034549-Alexandrium_andersonii.AAC.1
MLVPVERRCNPDPTGLHALPHGLHGFPPQQNIASWLPPPCPTRIIQRRFIGWPSPTIHRYIAAVAAAVADATAALD